MEGIKMNISEPQESKLTDGSTVYELFLYDPDQSRATIFNCLSEESAVKVKAALELYTINFD